MPTLAPVSEAVPVAAPALPQSAALDVFKTPTCGCCNKWVSHLRDNGFTPTAHDRRSLADIKRKYDIAPRLRSCHTAVSADGFFFEGHIPARYIAEFLANPPAGAVGLAVPGMPLGSPGMEAGERFTPYEIILVKEDGATEPYARIEAPGEQY